MVRHNAAVLWSNAQGERLADALRNGIAGDLAAAVASALDGHIGQISPFQLNDSANPQSEDSALDLLFLPWASESAALVLGRDITLERSLRSALIDSRQRYKDLVEASSDFAWETDSAGRFIFVSPAGAMGYAAAQLVGQTCQDFLASAEDGTITPFSTGVPIERAEVWLRDRSGESRCMLANALPLFDAGGALCGARGTCRDVTADRLRDAIMARAQHRQRLLAYLLRMLREELEPGRLLDAAAKALLPALGLAGVEIFCRTGGGKLRSVVQAGAMPPNGGFTALLAQLEPERGVAERRDDGVALLVEPTRCRAEWNGALALWRNGAACGWDEDDRVLLEEVAAQIGVANRQLLREDELEKLSNSDPLTGLANRRGFVARLESQLLAARAQDRSCALLYLDLDNFKQVNDRLGHEAGDRALTAVAGILRGQMRSGDLGGRLGGDEFALFFPNMNAADAQRKGQALIDATRSLQSLSADPAVPLGFSLGIALTDPKRAESSAELLARADAAMYRVKADGKSGFMLDPERAVGGDC